MLRVLKSPRSSLGEGETTLNDFYLTQQCRNVAASDCSTIKTNISFIVISYLDVGKTSNIYCQQLNVQNVQQKLTDFSTLLNLFTQHHQCLAVATQRVNCLPPRAGNYCLSSSTSQLYKNIIALLITKYMYTHTNFWQEIRLH